MNKKKFVFLDRDGTINADKGYIGDPAQIEILPKAAEAIKRLNDAGCRVFGVSNQSGVARGYYSTKNVEAVNKKVIELVARAGGVIEEIFYCPHHPEGKIEKYSLKCDCRKPAAGMIRQAEDKYGLKKVSRAAVIGDKTTDIGLGHSIGAKTVLVATGYGVEERKKIETGSLAPPDFYAADLSEAADYILTQL